VSRVARPLVSVNYLNAFIHWIEKNWDTLS
jgi:hypothetical protein